MNTIQLIGAIAVPPVLQDVTFRDTSSPKLTFEIAAAFEGFDGQPRAWRHHIELFNNTAPAVAQTITAGDLVAVLGSISIRSVPSTNGGEAKVYSDIKLTSVTKLGANVVGITRRDDGAYVADETLLNLATVIGTLTAAPYSGDGDASHPMVVAVGVPDPRNKRGHVDIIKAKTWDEAVAAQLQGTFERSTVLVEGMLVNEGKRDEATGLISGGPYIRMSRGLKL